MHNNTEMQLFDIMCFKMRYLCYKKEVLAQDKSINDIKSFFIKRIVSIYFAVLRGIF